MSSTTKSKTALVTEIPQDLKTLVSCVARGFYPYEYAIVMDYLIYYPCLKEDDIVELLKLERKQLRAIMAALRNDKLVKTKIRLETSTDGKSQKHNYYFINYQVMVNVIKYKLDHVRRKIETEERVTTNRASFICPTCVKTFTDLEVDQLFDPMSGSLRCTYCGSEVEEEGSSNPQRDSRTVLVKFNDQFQRLFDLLRKVENYKLAPELLDPDPTVITAGRGRSASAKPRDPDAAWSGDATRSSGMDYRSTVTINYDDGAGEGEERRKERLAWMEESTVEGSMAESVFEGDKDAAASGSKNAKKSDGASNESLSRDIFNTLLVHEKKGGLPPGAVTGFNPGTNASDSSDSDSDSDDVGDAKRSRAETRATADDEGEEDEEDDGPSVRVGDEEIPLDEVDDDVIARMTQQEKDAWIQLTQKIYADHYE